MEPSRQTKTRICNRLFLLTGFSNEDKNKLLNMIADLGGKFKETMEFVPECTHVISAKPIRSEKFLCGCASGTVANSCCFLSTLSTILLCFSVSKSKLLCHRFFHPNIFEFISLQRWTESVS
ncbi:hypothetical protein HOLleu_43787 [Holothuria leucospilota]|uniref:BRCT domain-containing protein n=1 Tax=Holothuria leucospilota TaxID=206669 RepID=A0A9Q0YB69_HOLLE|nr:hypothetical protein HOLleu_43787 [Holothuria leucospilota]